MRKQELCLSTMIIVFYSSSKFKGGKYNFLLNIAYNFILCILYNAKEIHFRINCKL